MTFVHSLSRMWLGVQRHKPEGEYDSARCSNCERVFLRWFWICKARFKWHFVMCRRWGWTDPLRRNETKNWFESLRNQMKISFTCWSSFHLPRQSVFSFFFIFGFDLLIKHVAFVTSLSFCKRPSLQMINNCFLKGTLAWWTSKPMRFNFLCSTGSLAVRAMGDAGESDDHWSGRHSQKFLKCFSRNWSGLVDGTLVLE